MQKRANKILQKSVDRFLSFSLEGAAKKGYDITQINEFYPPGSLNLQPDTIQYSHLTQRGPTARPSISRSVQPVVTLLTTCCRGRTVKPPPIIHSQQMKCDLRTEQRGAEERIPGMDSCWSVSPSCVFVSRSASPSPHMS